MSTPATRPSVEGPVLVVDDEPGMRETLVDVLESAGIPAESAESGAAALARAAAVHPALALVDQRLPDLSGIELSTRLKAGDPDLPVVLLTGYADLSSAIAAVGTLEDYLTKPVPPEELVRTVRAHLEQGRLRRENRELFNRLLDANASLEAGVAERTRDLNGLVAVAEAVADAPALDDLLRSALDTVSRVAGADGAAVYLTDNERRELLVLRACQPADWQLPPHLPQPPGGPVAMREIGTPPRECVTAPLDAGGRRVGVLVLSGIQPGHPRFLGAVAAQLAVAVQNAQRLGREHDTVERLMELSRLKSAFLATVSHELRTPLTALVGFTQTLESYGSRLSPRDRQDILERMVYQGGRLARLIEDLLDSSRIEFGGLRVEIHPVDTRRVIANAVENHLDCGRRIVVQTPPSLPAAAADEGRLEQVLDNLLQNAIKYSPPDSVITVGAEAPNGCIRMWVRDEGSGIDSAFLPHLFEPFTQADMSNTRRDHGVGLGLFIAHGLVEALGGTITADSHVGQGTTVTVTLPLAEVAAPVPSR